MISFLSGGFRENSLVLFFCFYTCHVIEVLIQMEFCYCVQVNLHFKFTSVDMKMYYWNKLSLFFKHMSLLFV